MSSAIAPLLPRAHSDERLAELAGQGQEHAFSALVDRHSRALLAFARTTAGPQLADDVLQQSLMQAWSSLQSGTEVQHVRGWLFQIVRRVAYATSQAGGCSELPLTLASSDDLHASTEQRMQLQAVVHQVGQLPEQQRLALVQTAVEGRSRADVAARLGVTEGAVRQLVHRARTRVRSAAVAMVPLPLLRMILRHGRRNAVKGPGGTEAAVAGTLAGATKTVAVVLSIGAMAVGAGTEIEHLRKSSGPQAALTPGGAAPSAFVGSAAAGRALQSAGLLIGGVVATGGGPGGAWTTGLGGLGTLGPSAFQGSGPAAAAPGAITAAVGDAAGGRSDGSSASDGTSGAAPSSADGGAGPGSSTPGHHQPSAGGSSDAGGAASGSDGASREAGTDASPGNDDSSGDEAPGASSSLDPPSPSSPSASPADEPPATPTETAAPPTPDSGAAAEAPPADQAAPDSGS